MSILFQVECDVPECRDCADLLGGPAVPIHASDDPTEFWIDQSFGLPEGWTESDGEEPIGGSSDRWQVAHYCPQHPRS
jgi:hypothetical protein